MADVLGAFFGTANKQATALGNIFGMFFGTAQKGALKQLEMSRAAEQAGEKARAAALAAGASAAQAAYEAQKASTVFLASAEANRRGMEGLGTVLRAAVNPVAMLAGLSGALASVSARVTGIFGPIEAFVSKANPGVTALFNYAFQDLVGVIGQILTPIIVAATPLVRMLADGFATMQPVFAQLTRPLTQMMGIFAELMVPVFKILTPLISILAAALEMLKPILIHIVDTIKFVADGILNVLNWMIKKWNLLAETELGKAIGLKRVSEIQYDDLKKRSSIGAAIQTAQYMDIEALGRATSLSAFQTGAQAEIPPGDVAMIDLLKKIADNTDDKKIVAAQTPEPTDAWRDKFNSWA